MQTIRSLVRAVVVAALILLAACSAPTRTSNPGDAQLRIERVDKEFDLARDVTRVAIDNPWGEINIRARDEREVGIHAVIQRMPPHYAGAKFRSRREGATLRIEVDLDGAAPTQGRVDIAVYLPNDLALALTTRSGRISAKRRSGPLEATTESGQLLASSRDRLLLHSVSGEIRATAIGKSWQGDSEIATDSGRIVLMVPTFGDIALDAETGGHLGTDFGLSVDEVVGGRHRAAAHFGQSTSSLRVRSRTGELVLEQLVLMGEDTPNPGDDD
ncbi:MAG: hypothetical protein ABIO49_07065 [Dokdonella sp.]